MKQLKTGEKVYRVGGGVTHPAVGKVQIHNPRPSTLRGKRRWENKSEAQKQAALKVYA